MMRDLYTERFEVEWLTPVLLRGENAVQGELSYFPGLGKCVMILADKNLQPIKTAAEFTIGQSEPPYLAYVDGRPNKTFICPIGDTKDASYLFVAYQPSRKRNEQAHIVSRVYNVTRLPVVLMNCENADGVWRAPYVIPGSNARLMYRIEVPKYGKCLWDCIEGCDSNGQIPPNVLSYAWDNYGYDGSGEIFDKPTFDQVNKADGITAIYLPVNALSPECKKIVVHYETNNWSILEEDDEFAAVDEDDTPEINGATG